VLALCRTTAPNFCFRSPSVIVLPTLRYTLILNNNTSRETAVINGTGFMSGVYPRQEPVSHGTEALLYYYRFYLRLRFTQRLSIVFNLGGRTRIILT
jgi:hypothetical protein